MDSNYLNLSQKELNQRIKRLFKILENCEICPRRCRVNRLKNKKGFCKGGSLPWVSAHHPHFGEETPLVGTGGSGTIFFTSCNLACVYCQNYEISQKKVGEEISFQKLAQMMLELQAQGCHNINLVTPTPQVPAIVKALSLARGEGLKLPLVYNTNTYDSLKILKLLKGIIDIYMPDTKYSEDKAAERLSEAPHYFAIMKRAIKEMHTQVGDLKIDKQGIAQKGLLIRHLVLPQGLAGTRKTMEFIAQEISLSTFVNIMDQYRPCYKAAQYPPLDRSITEQEFQEAIQIARKTSLKRIY